MGADVDTIIRNEMILRGQSDNWLAYYQDLADFCLPRKAWINAPKQHGERLDFNFLYDSTAIRALKIMAAGFHSNMTNPSTKWFAFQSTGPGAKMLNENRDVQQYWYDSTEVVLDMIRDSNFDTSAQEFYIDFGCFGMGDICSLPDFKKPIRFETIPIEQVMIEEDAYGNVCGVYRTFKLTAIQAYMWWGTNVGKSVMEKILQDKYFEEFDFMWYVGPRDRLDFSKIDNVNMPYASVWIAKKDKHNIDESGFRENPHHVGRFWKEANDPRGKSPGMDVLCDVRLKNAMKRTTLRAAMKNADPPVILPNKGFLLPLNQNPAAVNYRDPKVAADAVQAWPTGRGNFQQTELEIQETKDAIEQGFYVPLFRALSQMDKQMTVPEVQRRILENMVLMGPVVGRAQHEVWDPMTIRLYYEAGRKKLLPKMPDILRGREFGPTYLSPLAKAQKAAAVGDVVNFFDITMKMAGGDPNVMDVLERDKMVKGIGRMMGIEPQYVAEDQKIKEIRAKRQELAAAQMKLEAAQKGADVDETQAKGKLHEAKAGAEKK